MNIVQYAESSSKGNMASSIGWIDFGTNFTLNPDGTSIQVSNFIPGGYTIQFEIALTSVTSDPTTSNIPPIVAVTSPTFNKAPFGNVEYTCIPGNVSLFLKTNPDISNKLTYNFALTNLSVKIGRAHV